MARVFFELFSMNDERLLLTISKRRFSRKKLTDLYSRVLLISLFYLSSKGLFEAGCAFSDVYHILVLTIFGGLGLDAPHLSFAIFGIMIDDYLFRAMYINVLIDAVYTILDIRVMEFPI